MQHAHPHDAAPEDPGRRAPPGPGHEATKTLVEVSNGTGTGLDMPTAHDDPVGIEAVHVNLAVGQALEV